MKSIYDHLKFRLDSESAEYEFQIIPVPPYDFLEKNLSLEPYEYFGEVNEILGYRTHQVILYFNADILMRVELRFKGNVLTEIKLKLEELTIKLPPRVSLNLSFSQTSDHTIVIYQKSILNL